MKVTLICPTYNEEESIASLIESMLNQTKKPNEIIFVDSFSKDKTAEIIKKYIKRNKFIKLIQEKSNIAKARNIAIKNSQYDIIACTDASSKLKEDWLEKIVEPFKDKSIDVVSGGFIAISEGGIEDYISMITVKPMEEWDEKTFLPSGRSIAFRKEAWKAVGGYPEAERKSMEAGEDTLFDLKLKEKGFKFKLQKEAIVYWHGRKNIKDFTRQFFRYGRGDIENKNLFKMKKNILFFIAMIFWLVAFIGFLFTLPIVSLILFGLLLVYFILKGLRYAIKKKKIGCIFWIPILLSLKRFAYFFGVWRGLLG